MESDTNKIPYSKRKMHRNQNTDGMNSKNFENNHGFDKNIIA